MTDTRARELTELILRYGLESLQSNTAQIAPIMDLYRTAVDEIPEESRMEIMMTVAHSATHGEISPSTVMPFLFHDSSFGIISTAALHAGALWPSKDGDDLAGITELAGYARRFADAGDEVRAAAILTGLLQLGDRDVLSRLNKCWRWLPPEGRRLLSEALGQTQYAGVVDLLIDWLEECEAGEFGGVAGTLGKIPISGRHTGVIDVRRIIPAWGLPLEQGVQVLDRCSFAEYGSRIRARLLQIAADESPPRLMFQVLARWGIDYRRRHLAGVRMTPVHRPAPRALLPLVSNGATGNSQVLQWLPLEDGDFQARDGQLLVCWGIFNPMGPTWSCLGLLPTEDPATDLLFYRMLNPFAHEAGAVGIVRVPDRTAGALIGRLVHELFKRNLLDNLAGEGAVLLAGSPPSLVLVPWQNREFQEMMPTCWFDSPSLTELSVAGETADIRETLGRPWDRVTMQMNRALEKRESREGAIAEFEGPAPPSVIRQWLELVATDEHCVPELACFPQAWHGAIDHVGLATDEEWRQWSGGKPPPAFEGRVSMALQAFTFWQLDDFLARFGYPVFREYEERVNG